MDAANLRRYTLNRGGQVSRTAIPYHGTAAKESRSECDHCKASRGAASVDREDVALLICTRRGVPTPNRKRRSFSGHHGPSGRFNVTTLRRLGIGTFELTLMVVVAAFWIWVYAQPERPSTEPIPFDREVWLQNPSSYPNPPSARFRMMEDLLSRHPLIGMTRTDIERVIGPADYEEINSHHPYPGWDLGRDPDMASGTTSLAVRFGPDGQAEAIWTPQRGDEGNWGGR